MSCKTETAEPVDESLKDALTLYASFDEGYAADFARGDAKLYTTTSWDIDDGIEEISEEKPFVTRLTEGGRTGGALRFSSDWNPVVFYKGKDNVAYQEENWAGAFSFWLRIDPKNGLEEGYSDPFIITEKNWDNASLYVDFTEEKPRHFRFAAFADYWTWNPEGLSWDDYPAEQRPMIDLASHPFQSSEWTHVVLSFEGLNVETGEGVMKGYLNGEPVGELQKSNLTLSWDINRVLMALGRHYAGDFDDLAVFNRSLTDAEAKSLYTTQLIDLL